MSNEAHQKSLIGGLTAVVVVSVVIVAVAWQL